MTRMPTTHWQTCYNLIITSRDSKLFTSLWVPDSLSPRGHDLDASQSSKNGSHCWCFYWLEILTHWGRVTHICISKLTIIVSDNGLSPDLCQAIIWTNAGILSIGPVGTNFSEILLKFHTFSPKKMHLKRSSAKWRPFCLGLNVLRCIPRR